MKRLLGFFLLVGLSNLSYAGVSVVIGLFGDSEALVGTWNHGMTHDTTNYDSEHTTGRILEEGYNVGGASSTVDRPNLPTTELIDNLGDTYYNPDCGALYKAEATTKRYKDPPPGFDPFPSTPVSGYPNCSPIVIDMGQNGIHLGPPGSFVDFDIDADGTADSIQWVAIGGDEEFLTLDLNENNQIDDGSELFGTETIMLDTGKKARHGFIALAQYDEQPHGGNGDGLITASDRVWGNLLLWNDRNADGISTRNELSRISDSILVSLETKPRRSKEVDPAGNLLKYWAWAGNNAGGQNSMVDVFFAHE